MKRFITLLWGIVFLTNVFSQEWPVLKHYDAEHLLNIALPMGGIGTGTVSLGGRDELRDWQIMNKPGINFYTTPVGNEAPFFAIYVKSNDKAMAKALIGPLDDSEFMHYEGRPVNHHGLPRFSRASFDAAYPFCQVYLEDDLLPVSVKIKGFNPLIPGNVDAKDVIEKEFSNLVEYEEQTMINNYCALCTSKKSVTVSANYFGELENDVIRQKWKNIAMSLVIKVLKSYLLSVKN